MLLCIRAQERNSEILALGGYIRQMTYLFLLLPRRENEKKREGRREGEPRNERGTERERERLNSVKQRNFL